MSDEKKSNIQGIKSSVAPQQIPIEISKRAINNLLTNEGEDTPRLLFELTKWEPLIFLKACLGDPKNFNPLYIAALHNKAESFQTIVSWLAKKDNVSEKTLSQIKSEFQKLCLLEYSETDPYLRNILTTAWRHSEKVFNIIIQTGIFAEQYIASIKQGIPQTKSEEKKGKLALIPKTGKTFEAIPATLVPARVMPATVIPPSREIPRSGTIPPSASTPFFECKNSLASLKDLDKMLKNLQEIPSLKPSELASVEELVQELREVIADLPDKKTALNDYAKTISKILNIGAWLPNPPDKSQFTRTATYKPIADLYGCASPTPDDEIGNILFDLQARMLGMLNRCLVSIEAREKKVLFSH